MRRVRVWHLGFAVLWVAFLSWLVLDGRETSEAAKVLTFWVAASVLSLGCTLGVGRLLNRWARPGRRLRVLLVALFLVCVFVGLFMLICEAMDKYELYRRGWR